MSRHRIAFQKIASPGEKAKWKKRVDSMRWGHSLLVAAYHILRDDVEYRDLGADHFDRLNHHRLTDCHVQRLEQLGYQVNLQSQPDAA
jgi:hypothetical protein